MQSVDLTRVRNWLGSNLAETPQLFFQLVFALQLPPLNVCLTTVHVVVWTYDTMLASGHKSGGGHRYGEEDI